MRFALETAGDGPRLGHMSTSRGEFPTPVFMPVGTQATLKTVLPHEIWETGTRIMLSNAYHLFLRPGTEVVRDAGGLGAFMNWRGSTLTDSGGFQVMSLGPKIEDAGAKFRSHIDGSPVFFSPEVSIEAQANLGADIIMCFDQCSPYPTSREDAARAASRTALWARRCKEMEIGSHQSLFGIVQGSVWPDLRVQSAKDIKEMGFPGYAIGGLSVGEEKGEFAESLRAAISILPKDKPRYLMGVGHPSDLVTGVLLGVDMFDCVLPSRNARHGRAFTFSGAINLRNRAFARDYGPIEDGCDCRACTGFTRAYVRHLLAAGETLASTLLTIHNIRFFQRFMEQLRGCIRDGTVLDFQRKVADVFPFSDKR